MRKLWQTIWGRIRSWMFPGVWVLWEGVDGSLTIANQVIEERSGRAWIGIPGFGSLRWCPPVEVVYRTGNQTYRAALPLSSGTVYIIRGAQKMIEAVSSSETKKISLTRQDVQ